MSCTDELELSASHLEMALNAIVSEADWWLDVPFAFNDDDMERIMEDTKSFEMPCGFCGSRFYPIQMFAPEGWWGSWCYYQAGYWFGTPGDGKHFPICSDGCYDALHRQLEKRRWHTKAEMDKVGRARRLLKECKVVVRRLRSAQRVEGRPAISAGSHSGHQVVR